MRLTSLLAILLLSVLPLRAGDDDMPRPVTASYTVGVGSSHLTDTYLSPIRYSGWSTSLAYRRMQAAPFSPGRLTMMLDLSATLDRARNPARNSTMWGALLRLEWGLARRWTPVPSLTLAAGGTLSAEGASSTTPATATTPPRPRGP